MIIRIKEGLPPTLNEQIRDARSGWRLSAQTKKNWTNRIAIAAWNMEKFELNEKIWCEFHWYIKNFGRDADNVAAAAKFIFDGLVAAGTISKDNLTIIQSPILHYYHRSKRDRFELILSNSPIQEIKSLVESKIS
jgi:hypothetical protein